MTKRVPNDQQHYMNMVSNLLLDIHDKAIHGQKRIMLEKALKDGNYFQSWSSLFPGNDYNTFELFMRKIYSHFTYVREWRKHPKGVHYAMYENAYGERRNWNENKSNCETSQNKILS